MTTAGATELPVWISGEQHRVTGVDKHTTCVEVIRALVDSLEIADSKKKEPADPGQNIYRKYVILERWRRVERPLEAEARILKLWQRWGEEQKHVKLTLKKTPNGQHSASNSKGSGFPRQRSKTSKLSLPLLLHKKSKSSKSTPTVVVPKPGRNVVRRGSISSGGGNDRKPYYPSANHNATALDQLRRLVAAQQETLKAQRRHIQRTDAAIEAHETQVHLTRVARMGVDYVQEVYLGEDDEANFIESEKEPDWVLYSRLAEVRRRLEQERARIRDLSERIRVQTASMNSNSESAATARANAEEVEEILHRTRSELDRLRRVSGMQSATLEHNGKTDGECHRLLNEKNACYQRLQAEEAAANAEHERLLQIKRGLEFHSVHSLYNLTDGIQRSPKQQGHGQGSWRLWRRRKYQHRNPGSPANSNSPDSEESTLDTLV